MLFGNKLLIFFNTVPSKSNTSITLTIKFFSFEMLSWYHFGDIPTISVFIRLIIGFIVIEGIIYFGYKIIKKKYLDEGNSIVLPLTPVTFLKALLPMVRMLLPKVREVTCFSRKASASIDVILY